MCNLLTMHIIIHTFICIVFYTLCTVNYTDNRMKNLLKMQYIILGYSCHARWWTVQMTVIPDSIRKFLHLHKQMFFIDDTKPVRQYTLYNAMGISVNHDQSHISIKQKCTVSGISLYTCTYSPLLIERSKIACTCKHFCTILYCSCD